MRDCFAQRVVIDIGSEKIRVGFTQDSVPSVIESPFYVNTSAGGYQFGLQSHLNYDTDVRSFVNYSRICDWPAFEAFFQYAFKEKLKVDPQNTNVLVSLPVDATEKYRHKLCQTLLEKLNVYMVNFRMTPVLQCASSYNTSGIIVDCGAAHTTVTPVVDMAALVKSSETTTDVCGDRLRDEMYGLVGRNPEISLHDQKLPTNLKFWRIAERLDTLIYNRGFKFLHADGKVLDFLSNNQLAFDTMDKYVTGQYAGKIVEMLTAVANNTGVVTDLQYLVQNVYISGGVSRLTKLHLGVDKWLQDTNWDAPQLNIGTDLDRDHSLDAYVGGTILASKLDSQWFGKHEYAEDPSVAIHQIWRKSMEQ